MFTDSATRTAAPRRGTWKLARLGLLIVAGTILLSGCASVTSNDADPSPERSVSPATRSTASPTRTQSQTPTPTPLPDSDGDGVVDARDEFPNDPTRTVQLYYPSGDPVLAGYPLIVDTAQLDRRLASWIDTPQAVALAPGVYAGYNPAVSDLRLYLEGPTDGDCAVRDMYFPVSGGACWSGVLASPAEPTQ